MAACDVAVSVLPGITVMHCISPQCCCENVLSVLCVDISPIGWQVYLYKALAIYTPLSPPPLALEKGCEAEKLD